MFESLMNKECSGEREGQVAQEAFTSSYLSDVVSGMSHKAMRETSKRQNQPVQGPSNAPILPECTKPPVLPAGMMPQILFIHPAFGLGPAFYISLTALIRKPDDMLSLPLGQYILDYEPPHGFVIPAFTTFDGSTDPYDHMLHYNQAMILNASNDCLLCKVFLASLWGSALA